VSRPFNTLESDLPGKAAVFAALFLFLGIAGFVVWFELRPTPSLDEEISSAEPAPSPRPRRSAAPTPTPSRAASTPEQWTTAPTPELWTAARTGPTPEMQPDAPAAEESLALTDASASEQPPEGQQGIPGFPSMNTKPVKPGLAIPEDFVLPPGYVRHHQFHAGRLLAPVLRFHPDYQPVDAHGAPVPIPEDRFVPPELAPPGLPIEYIELPKDAPAAPR
jgi:hypothetical protein